MQSYLFLPSSTSFGIDPFNSCKKDLLEPQAPSKTLLAKTKLFYNNQLLKLCLKLKQQGGISEQADVVSTRKKPIPIWEDALVEKNSDGKTIVTVQFAKFKITSEDLDYTRKFTFSESGGEIVDGEIVEVYSSPEVIAQDGEEMILRAGEQEIKGFNGSILSYNIDYSYKDGKYYKNGLTKKGSTYINSGLPDISKNNLETAGTNMSKPQLSDKKVAFTPSKTISAIRPELENGQNCEDYYWVYIEKNDWGEIVYMEVLGYAYSVCIPNQDPSMPGGIFDYYIDCAGVRDGTAYPSACGCIGGTTGFQSCAQKERRDSLNKIMKSNCLNPNQLDSLTNLMSSFLSGDGNTEWACLHKTQYNLMISKGAKFDFCMNSNMAYQQHYNAISESFNFQSGFSFILTTTFEHEFFHAYQDKFLSNGTNQYAIGTSSSYPNGYINIEFETALYSDITRDRVSQEALMNSDVPENVKIEYITWLNTITANNTTYPKTFTDFGGQYYYFMEKFKQYSGYTNKGSIDYNLKPLSLLNLFSTSNCK